MFPGHLLSKERGGEECPVTNLCEISGLIYAAPVYVCECVRDKQTERICREYS